MPIEDYIGKTVDPKKISGGWTWIDGAAPEEGDEGVLEIYIRSWVEETAQLNEADEAMAESANDTDLTTEVSTGRATDADGDQWDSDEDSPPDYNAYSLEVHVVDGRISDVARIGHCHMCGGQGVDDELSEFYSPNLEAEAEEALKSIVTRRPPAKVWALWRRQQGEIETRRAADKAEQEAVQRLVWQRRLVEDPLGGLRAAIWDGDESRAAEAVQAALASKMPPAQIYEEGLSLAIAESRRRFLDKEFGVPYWLFCRPAQDAALEILRPFLEPGTPRKMAKVLVGEVGPGLHFGALAEALMGWDVEVIEFGQGPTDDFVDAVAEHKPALLCIWFERYEASHKAAKVSLIAQRLREAGLRENMRMVVAGCEEAMTLAAEIAADGSAAADLGETVQLILELVAGDSAVCPA